MNSVTTVIRTNQWAKLRFYDPEVILPKMQQLRFWITSRTSNYKLANLRINKLRKHREAWLAAVFCYGMSKIMRTKVYFSPYEASDYDAIALRNEGNAQHYTPLQIKELVPEHLNPNASLNAEIDKLKRYPVSKETVVIIHSNRTGILDLSSFVLPKLEIAQLWIVGASNYNQMKWFLIGDLLKSRSVYEFNIAS